MQRRDLLQDAGPLVHIVVSHGSDIPVGLFVTWLSSKLMKSRVRKIKINRRKVEISPDGILKAIEETIEIEHEK